MHRRKRQRGGHAGRDRAVDDVRSGLDVASHRDGKAERLGLTYRQRPGAAGYGAAPRGAVEGSAVTVTRLWSLGVANDHVGGGERTVIRHGD